MSSLSQIRHEVETKVIRHRGSSGTWQRTVTFYPKDGYLGSAEGYSKTRKRQKNDRYCQVCCQSGWSSNLGS